MARKIVVTAKGRKLDMDALKKSQPKATAVRNFKLPSSAPIIATAPKATIKTMKSVVAKNRKPKINATKPAPRPSFKPTVPPVNPVATLLGVGPASQGIQTQSSTPKKIEKQEKVNEKATKEEKVELKKEKLTDGE